MKRTLVECGPSIKLAPLPAKRRDMNTTICSRSPLLAIILAGFLAGCVGTYAPTAFTPATVDTKAYVAKVDAFVVVMDASDSMNFYYTDFRPNFFTAKDVVNNMNQTIPALGYKSALVGFGTGSCVNYDDAIVVYGPAPYRRADFANGLSKLECAGGRTPISEGLDVGGETVKSASGKVALILVSDFSEVHTGDVSEVADKLKAEYGDRLCIHTIKVGGARQTDDVIGVLAGVNSCGSSVDAASLASADAMARYVTDVLLTPAAVPAAAVKYEKNTVSASALFDTDKAVLKDKGKATLHALDESIKGRGAKVVDISVIGYTDSDGTEKYNMGLSMRRAQAVRDYMVSEGVARSMIKVSGEGEANPVASNATPEGRAQNRRVEIYVGTKQPAI
jgi:OOP family OmpA-OmpF porin